MSPRILSLAAAAAALLHTVHLQPVVAEFRLRPPSQPPQLNRRIGSFVAPRQRVGDLHSQQERPRLPDDPMEDSGDIGAALATQLEATDKAEAEAESLSASTRGSTSNSNTSTGSKKTAVALTALGSYTAILAAAKLGVLPGPSGSPSYTDVLIARDLGSSLLCAVLGVAFVKAITTLATNGVLEPRDSRKIIHTLSAPLFMLLWPLFSDAGGARYFAAVVPLANAVRLAVAASGSGDEEELASAVSRSGDAKEAIGGPFFYVLVLLASVLTFWRDDLTGIVAVSTMAAGDGLADLIGRRFGKGNKWFFNQDKSIAGSAAFFVGASSCSVALACWFGYTGALTLPLELSDLAFRIIVISTLAAIVELIPVIDDNWSVPLSAAVLSAALLHG